VNNFGLPAAALYGVSSPLAPAQNSEPLRGRMFAPSAQLNAESRKRDTHHSRYAVSFPQSSTVLPLSIKEMKHGRGMNDESAQVGHSEAQSMLDVFASVGATQFDVTWTTRAGEKEWFRRAMTYADLTRTPPAMLDAAPTKQRNIIVRPHGSGVTFIQLDDLSPAMLARLAPAVFLALQTSPGNFQAWIASDGAEDKEFARRLRKGAGADATASGATRVAGSLNFKDKYAPAFPRVAIHARHPGRKMSAAELDQLGVVAAPEVRAGRPSSMNRMRAAPGRRRWPSYARCLEGAPLNSERNGPDVSRADFVWCMTAIDWGWDIEETAARLIEESRKARENGEGYANLTARNAATAVERSRGTLPRVARPSPDQS
jgi:RepB DNA-primase from phage plasmid